MISEELRDISNALNIRDDDIVFGRTPADHEVALGNVLSDFPSEVLLSTQRSMNSLKLRSHSLDLFLCEQHFRRPTQSGNNQERARSDNTIWITQFPRNGNVLFQVYYKFQRYYAALKRTSRKDAKFHWMKDHERAFNAVKATLTSDTVMSYFDPLKETALTTDVSPFGLSAIREFKIHDFAQDGVLCRPVNECGRTVSRISVTKTALGRHGSQC